MDEASDTLHPLEAMEACLYPCKELDETRATAEAGLGVCHKRQGSVVEFRCSAHESGLSETLP